MDEPENSRTGTRDEGGRLESDGSCSSRVALVERREADAQTASCEAPHFQYHVAGKLAIRMDDGTEFVAEPGDVTSLPSGHDAWVLGDEPVVVVDWFGASNYAKETA
jgi:hypothetical protein